MVTLKKIIKFCSTAFQRTIICHEISGPHNWLRWSVKWPCGLISQTLELFSKWGCVNDIMGNLHVCGGTVDSEHHLKVLKPHILMRRWYLAYYQIFCTNNNMAPGCYTHLPTVSDLERILFKHRVEHFPPLRAQRGLRTLSLNTLNSA